MGCRLELASSFPQLLQELVSDLRLGCRRDLLGPKWVLVPTSTAANHLRIEIAGRLAEEVLAGVRVVPVTGFVHRLTLAAENPGGQRWEPMLDLLLCEMVQQLRPDSPLARLRELPSGFHLLRPTFLDLADAGFGLDQQEILEELAQEPDLAPIEQETLRLYGHWIRRLEARRWAWQPLLEQRLPDWIWSAEAEHLQAALACESGQTPRVFVYGFYDFTDVNLQILAALARRLDLTIFYPFAGSPAQPHPAFTFAAQVLEDLRLRLGTALEPSPTRERSRADSPMESFFLKTFPEGEIAGPPGRLTFQKASGIRAEVLSAATRIRAWLDQPRPPAAHQILVVAPELTAYEETMRQLFPAFAIPFRLLDLPGGLTAENRPLRMVGRIWEERAPVEWVLAHLRNWPHLPVAAGIELNRFESKLRRWGIWGGGSWQLLLEADREEPAAEGMDGGMRKTGEEQFTAQEKRLAQEILSFWVQGPGSQDTLLPEQAGRFLRQVAERWLPEPALLDALLEALEQVRRHTDLPIRSWLLRELLVGAAGDQIRSDLFNQNGVLITSLMRARGLTARGIVILGLASGSLPAIGREDPLLTDASRGRLMEKARQVGHRLPIKSWITEEMTLLFFLLNTCAPTVHWVIPESDERGRRVAPTPWVQRYLQHFEAQQGQPGGWHRIPRGPAQQARHLRGLDPDRGSWLPPEFLLHLHPDARFLSTEIPYAYLFRMHERRQREGACNGCIPGAAVSAEKAEKARVQVTDLEVLAHCPFRFYAERLMKWTPLEPLQFPDDVSPLDWGGMLHAYLEQLLQPYLPRKWPLQRLAEALLGPDGARLEETLAHLPPRYHLRLQALPAPFRQAVRFRLIRTARNYLERVRAEAGPADVPLQLEFKLRVPFPGVEGLHISGQVDRLDRQQGALRIYDYKSGLGNSPTELQRQVALGHRVQPILYPWMVSRQWEQEAETSFAFVFLGETPPRVQSVSFDSRVEAFLLPLADILRAGNYLPTSTEAMLELQVSHAQPCRFCQHSSLCRRFEPDAGERFARLSRTCLGSRLESMAAGSREGP